MGLRYTPLFPFVASLAAEAGSSKGAFRVVSDTYVTDDSGTGVVHQVRGERDDAEGEGQAPLSPR